MAILIVIGYFVVLFLLCYILGRLDAEEIMPLMIAWPVVLPLMSILWIATFLLSLGKKHSGF